MSRLKSVSAVSVLALALFAAPLVHAQEGASTPATQSAPTKAPAHPAKAQAAAKHAMPRTDLNSATKEELMKLPGVGDATADRIIAARPFKSKAELLSKGLVNKTEYTKLSAHVVAKQEAKK